GIGLLLIIFFMVSLQFLPDRGQASGALKPYQITEGETLWTIAESLKDDKEDTRDYIYKLRKINKLEDAHIYPGQIIYYK
ncbi:MAG: LysM peptidoglycan-binding domain-containing protein, partial [Tissierellia bacterium]|nr:LysM peptidoglycan-binding domain-containing protein [Tissierellia bacterium]